MNAEEYVFYAVVWRSPPPVNRQYIIDVDGEDGPGLAMQMAQQLAEHGREDVLVVQRTGTIDEAQLGAARERFQRTMDAAALARTLREIAGVSR